MALRVADAAGDPVAEVASLVLRPVSVTELSASASATAESLFRLEWFPAPVARSEDSGESAGWAVLGDVESDGWRGAGVPVTSYDGLAGLVAAVDGGATVPETVVLPVACGGAGVGDVVAGVLGVVRGWLAEERFAKARLVVLTSGAVEVASSEDGARDVLDLAGAGVWGLVRSAISEHPGRFVLADVDGEEASFQALTGALGEGQFAVRGGAVWLPRLVRMASGGVLEPPVGVGSGWRL
ncbi:polyketide synthase, partial [Streptomyces botrytidirepellens]